MQPGNNSGLHTDQRPWALLQLSAYQLLSQCHGDFTGGTPVGEGVVAGCSGFSLRLKSGGGVSNFLSGSSRSVTCLISAVEYGSSPKAPTRMLTIVSRSARRLTRIKMSSP